LVNFKTLEVLPSTPRFFSYGCSPVVFDQYAECPTWHAFNQEIFGGDSEMIQAAQEFAGYGLSDLTSMQKIGWLMGPTRSGKSTWIKLVEHVIGSKNVIGPSMFTLAQPFGLQSFIGAKWATFGDARVPERADRKIILDRILSVSGEDTQTIERKFQSAWSGRLPTRLFFISNELPELADTANAFAARIILLQTQRSFLGSEDEELEHKLRAEAPGILNWMLAGYRRLRQRGRFIQPSASADALKSLRDLSSPMSAFVAECCTEGLGERVQTVDFFHARKAWDQLQGIDRRLTQAQCGKQIRSAVAAVRIEQPRADGGRIREYAGVSLNAYGRSLLDPQGRLT
jgi:putative DNA primase/helicase